MITNWVKNKQTNEQTPADRKWGARKNSFDSPNTLLDLKNTSIWFVRILFWTGAWSHSTDISLRDKTPCLICCLKIKGQEWLGYS